jgi:hypothetical protein
VNDFLITMITLYPWAGWLLAVLAVAGLAWGSLAVAWAAGLVTDWGAYRRLVWRSKSVVRKAVIDGGCPVCAAFEGEREAAKAEKLAGQDAALSVGCPVCYAEAGQRCMRIPGMVPTNLTHETRVAAWRESKAYLSGYQHPDGDDDDWPDDDPPGRLAGLADIFRGAYAAGMMDEDQLPDDDMPRCNDRDCDQYGFIHPPPCRLMPTMPAACFTDEWVPISLPDGPAEEIKRLIAPLTEKDGVKPVEPIDMGYGAAQTIAQVTGGVIPAKTIKGRHGK